MQHRWGPSDRPRSRNFRLWERGIAYTKFIVVLDLGFSVFTRILTWGCVLSMFSFIFGIPLFCFPIG